MEKFYIYILELENGKYYVGRTKNLDERYSQHLNGTGSAWTKKYPPIRRIQVVDNADIYDEDKYTKICMAQYGINNVRGGAYTQIMLTPEQQSLISSEINNAKDKCFQCGLSGHFAKQCKSQIIKSEHIECEICGRINHKAEECYAKKTIHGHQLIESCKIIKGCKICGRTNHKSDQCYAKTKIDGNIIGKCCKICGRLNHKTKNCFAKTTIDGKEIIFTSDSDSDFIFNDNSNIKVEPSTYNRPYMVQSQYRQLSQESEPIINYQTKESSNSEYHFNNSEYHFNNQKSVDQVNMTIIGKLTVMLPLHLLHSSDMYLNIRLYPSHDADIVGKIYNGTIFDVYDIVDSHFVSKASLFNHVYSWDNLWAKTTFNGSIGFVKMKQDNFNVVTYVFPQLFDPNDNCGCVIF